MFGSLPQGPCKVVRYPFYPHGLALLLLFVRRGGSGTLPTRPRCLEENGCGVDGLMSNTGASRALTLRS